MNRVGWIGSIGTHFAGDSSGEDFNSLVGPLDWIDVEFPIPDGIDDLASEHEVLDVLVGYDHSLLSREPADLAGVEKPLDFLIHAADRLNDAKLIDRTCDRNILSQGNAGKSGKSCIQFS